MDRARLVRVALGDERADLVLRGCNVVSTPTRELFPADIVVSGERIAAVGLPLVRLLPWRQVTWCNARRPAASARALKVTGGVG